MASGNGQGTVLLTDAIEIGAQGVVREVLFPQAWGEEVDLQGGMGIDALPDIDQIDIGIDALEATGSEQTLKACQHGGHRLRSNRTTNCVCPPQSCESPAPDDWYQWALPDQPKTL